MNRSPLIIALSCALLSSPKSSAQEPGKPTDSGIPPAIQLYRQAIADAVARARESVEAKQNLKVDHSTWANPWRVKTEQIEIVTTESYGAGLATAKGQETMLQAMADLLNPEFTPTEPFVVFVAPNLGQYNNLNGNADARSSIYGSYYNTGIQERPVVTYQQQNPTLQQMYITHGLSNAFVRRAFNSPNLPAWIDEGLGSYFALWWSRTWGPSELKRITEQGQYIPLSRLLSDPITSYTPADTHQRFIELGMLFTYLLHHREDTRSEWADEEWIPGGFARYLRRQLSGEGESDPVTEQLLSTDLSSLEADFRAFDFEGN
ncbi:MAG: hypothetical protein ACYTG5_07070 [Planctomycetota bacterium]|jgi:hypothetical protein